MRRPPALVIVGVLLLSSLAAHAAPGVSPRDERVAPLARQIEAKINRPIGVGEYVLRPLSELNNPSVGFQTGPRSDVESTNAPGCNYYYVYFANAPQAPCNLFVETAELSDPNYNSNVDLLRFDVAVPPGYYAYFPYLPVNQCADFITVQYRYQCGSQVKVRQSLESNLGPFGFTWEFHYVSSVNPNVATLYVWGPSSAFCTAPFGMDGQCSAPPISVQYVHMGRSSPVPVSSGWIVAALSLLLGALGLVVLRKRLRSA